MGAYIQQWDVTGSSGNVYKVSVKPDGTFACSCLGWTRHTPRKDCKHIKAMKAGEGYGMPDSRITTCPYCRQAVDKASLRLHTDWCSRRKAAEKDRGKTPKTKTWLAENPVPVLQPVAEPQSVEIGDGRFTITRKFKF